MASRSRPGTGVSVTHVMPLLIFRALCCLVPPCELLSGRVLAAGQTWRKVASAAGVGAGVALLSHLQVGAQMPRDLVPGVSGPVPYDEHSLASSV